PPRWSWADLAVAPGTVVLALDAVQDPGNVGTMLRTTLALGGSGVIALKGTAELTNPKVVRGSMGALFRVPAIPATETEMMRWVNATGIALWLADAAAPPLHGAPDRATRPPRPPVCLVMGNEGAGVGSGLASQAVRRVGIPLAAGTESLNVAVAAGILL